MPHTFDWPVHLGAPHGGCFDDEAMDLLAAGEAQAALSRKSERVTTFASRLLAGNAGEALGVVARKETLDSWAAILPEMSEPGQGEFRIQFFDAGGFSGHRVVGSADGALQQIVKEGFVHSDPGAMTKVIRSS